jgi:acetolactate synthase-1/2/3 large subunit
MESLRAEGVKEVFGIPGGANLPTYDAMVDADFRHVQVRHEQGGGHAAEGYAKASGKVGVAFATSGPGATNLVTAIADAMLDSVPTVFITGQVRTDLIGTDGFQEADILGATLPFVKHSFQVTDARQIPEYVHEAFHIASTGRPGPVLLDIPQDLSRADIDYAPRTEPVELPGYKPSTDGNIKQIRIAAKALANARRPILYSGGGVINANASEELRELAGSDRFPITSTLMGLGAYPASGENWLGMLGMHGTVTANYAMDKADLIVAIGARFDDRITRRVRPARQGDPHRRRPGRDLQERRRPYPDRRRRQAGAAAPDPRVPGAADRLVAARRLVEPDSRLAGGAPALLRARQGR